MSTTIKFLDSIIRNLAPTDKRQIYWCDGCPGFGLRLTPSGSRSFVYKYMNGRQSRWLTIGKYPEWSVRKARQQYDAYYEQVNDYGRDPALEAKEEKQLEQNKLTVVLFLDTYLNIMRLKGKQTIAEEESTLRRHVIPAIGNKLLEEVTPQDIDEIQTRILKQAQGRKCATRGGKVAVRHTLAYTRQLFNLAKHQGHITENPIDKTILLGSTGTRDRVLSFKEIWLFWHGIENYASPVTSKALKFLLVSMQRSTEVRHMRYQSLKRDENIWQMETHETKNRTMHRVPINPYAQQILNEVEPYTMASPYVFGATRALHPPQMPKTALEPLGKTAMAQAIRRNRKALGVDDFCPHDLRRTGATWITAAGLPKLYARLMLNHTDGDRDVTGEVYVQYSYDFEKRRAADVWAFILDQIVICKDTDDIPSLDQMRTLVSESGLL